jgi:RND family efflux transporter MFP subunit
MGFRTVAIVLSVACTACSNHEIPTAAATRGEFIEWTQVQGEVKASRSLTLRAPLEAGELRIVTLLPNGAAVAKGAVIAEFDKSTIARTVDEKRTEVNGFQAEIDKARSEASTREAESVTAESAARFEVERAKLDYSGREALSRVEAEQTRLKILDAEHRLRESAARLESVKAESRASLAAARQKKAKAARDLERAQRQLSALQLVAPADGALTIRRNPRTPWMAQQPFKPGDQVWPGAEIAELPDPSSLYLSSRVDEIERGRLSVGQRVVVRAEALPDRELKARVQSISALAKSDFTSWPPPRNFDLTVALEETDPRLRPGMSVTMRIAVDRLPEAVMVPADAVFERDGHEVVYVVRSGRHERRQVQVERRSAERIVLKAGVEPGEHVALIDPTIERKAR